MNAGSLDFTLGLNASNFLNAIGSAAGKLAAFSAAALGVGSAFRAMEAAVEKGGQLWDVSRRAGTSVAALYQIQEGFKQIGESAEGAGQLILRMQRLAGDADSAKKLKALGLDPKAFGQMDAAGQVSAAAGALGKLNPSAQGAAAFDVFGREGAQSILAVTRSLDDFNASLAETGESAATWQKNAERFDMLGDKITAMKSKVGAFFAEVAGWIYDVVDVANNAIAEGRYFELLSAGFKGLFEFVAYGWLEVTSGMTAAFLDFLAQSSTGILKLAAIIGGIPGLAGIATGMMRGAAGGFESVSGTTAALSQWAGGKRAGAFDEFNALFGEFKSPERKSIGPGTAGGDYTGPEADSKRVKPDVTNLEKMGFIMGGGGNVLVETGKRTARATEQTVVLVQKLLQKNINAESYNAVV